ncbi:hypothetical protein BDN67DRAFT_968870 [Paxillus ammoniavirescens]|nr:hypothetical protein BDN67DRAFT_968870 [Paxillus ammoniavirescens]
MSIPSTIHPVFAFVYTVWSFVLRLVHSFAGLFSSNNRSPEATCTLPKTHPCKAELLVPQASLRSSIVTPRNFAVFTSFSPYGPGRQSTPASGHNDVPTNPLTPIFQDVLLRQTSSRDGLDCTDDAELGLSTAITPITADTCDQPQISAALAMRLGTATPDTPSPIHDCLMSPFSMMPLTPPDRCYFPGLSSANDYLYREPWPINTNIDRNKPRKLPSSPLKTSFGSDLPSSGSMARAWDSPGRWAPVQIWTSTPRKKSPVHEMCLGPFGAPMFGTVQSSLVDTPFLAADISVHPSGLDPDDPTHTAPNIPAPANENHSHGQDATQQADMSRSGVCTLRPHETRLPDKHDGSQSCSHSTEWYDASAYVSSPVAMLSPPNARPPLSASELEAESVFGSEADLPLFGARLTLFAPKSGMRNDRLPTPTSSVLRARGPTRSSSDPGISTQPCGRRTQCVGTLRHGHDFQKEKRAEPTCNSHLDNLVVGGGFVSQVEGQGGVGVSVPAVA